MRQTIRSWKLHLRSGSTWEAMAREVNLITRGWIGYFGRYYRPRLIGTLQRINAYLVRRLRRKFKKLRHAPARARGLLAGIARREPRFFAHREYGARPAAG